MTSPLPTERFLNPALTAPGEGEVVLLEVLGVRGGDLLSIAFEDATSDWRQGVWLGTDGMLAVDGFNSPQFVLWQDTAPEVVRVQVLETDGKLRLYNVWDSGRGLGDHESQSATSGMVVEVNSDGSRRYRCNDIGFDPAFDKVVFTVRSA